MAWLLHQGNQLLELDVEQAAGCQLHVQHVVPETSVRCQIYHIYVLGLQGHKLKRAH